MKKTLSLLLWLILPVCCMAQVSHGNLSFKYEYDAAGNRVLRKVVNMTQRLAPPDSIMNDELSITNYELGITDDDKLSRPAGTPSNFEGDLGSAELSLQTADLTPDSSPLTPDFFVERLAQTEIKIYPNPATEKVTLEIAGWETLQTGVFKLFTMNGQLLQECPVHSAATEVSLSGLAKGSYILKVHINDHTEDWKIIKN